VVLQTLVGGGQGHCSLPYRAQDSSHHGERSSPRLRNPTIDLRRCGSKNWNMGLHLFIAGQSNLFQKSTHYLTAHGRAMLGPLRSTRCWSTEVHQMLKVGPLSIHQMRSTEVHQMLKVSLVPCLWVPSAFSLNQSVGTHLVCKSDQLLQQNTIDWGLINNRHGFFTVLEAGSPRSRCG